MKKEECRPFLSNIRKGNYPVLQHAPGASGKCVGAAWDEKTEEGEKKED